MAKGMKSRMTGGLVALGVAGACVLGGFAPAAAVQPAGRAAAPVATVALPGGATAVAVQGNVIAAISNASNNVSIIDAPSLAVRSTTALPLAAQEVVLSPDGSLAYVLAGKIAYDQGQAWVYGGIFVVDTATGAVVRSGIYDKVYGRTCIGAMGMAALAISPDGSRLNTSALGCGWNTDIWTIDPVSLAVIAKAFTYRASGEGVGMPYGPMAAFADRTITMGRGSVWKCPDEDGCPVPSGAMTSSGDTASAFAAGPFSALTRDPVGGTLLGALGESLVWVDPVSAAQLRSIDGLGTGFAALLVDASTGLIYGWNGQGTVVVDAAARKVLGMHMVELDAVLGGRGYRATATGIEVIDAGRSLAATKPLAVTAKVSPASNGTVKATVTWRAPATAGSSPVTGYRVQAYSKRNSDDKKPAVKTCSTRTKTCVLTLKQVTTTTAKKPALYSFTVTPINGAGDGESGSTSVTAPRG